MSKNIALAYCADNQNTAQEIDRQLSPAFYQFQHFSCSKTTSESSLSDLLSDTDLPILLIISDNFLKSAQCMSRALRLLQKKGEQILAVVIDGERIESDGATTYTPTDFDRVSDIIQYINYWQDRYLDLRKQKRQIDDADESGFNAHLKVMREISGEVGEFLRVLRNSNHMPWSEFAENDFESFFAFQQDAPGWEHYQSLAASQDPKEETIADEPMDDIDVSDIPGISLVQEKQNDTPQEVLFEIANEPSAAIDKEEEVVNELEEEIAEPEENVTGSVEADTPEEEVEVRGRMAEEEELEKQTMTDQVEEEVVEEEKEKEEEEVDNLSELLNVKQVIEISEQLFAKEQTEEGLALLDRSITKLPREVDLRYHYAISLAQLKNDIPTATSQLETILEIDPDNQDAHFLIGKFAEINQDYDTAINHYEKTIQLNGGHADVDFQLGKLLAVHYPQRQAEAARYLKKAAKAQPENTEINYNYALFLHEKLGKSKKATKYLKRTIKSAPEHPFAHYDLALIYHQLGKRQEALKAYHKAAEVNPELKTPENDEAFAIPETIAITNGAPNMATYPESKLKASIEADTIEALKQNIYRLEEMIKAKAQRQEEEKAARELAAQIPQKDEVVFITGATSGIGKATAKKFAANGYKLILNGRRIDRLKAMKKELEQAYHSQILLLPFDVRDVEAVQATIDSLGKKWQNIDILINNAGKAKGLDPIHEGQLHHWEEMIDTNVKGLLYLTRTIAPSMVERNAGHIINICSTAGKEVYPKGNVYCATKFAVDALTKAMRIDLHPYNIRVSQVSPGHVEETEFAAVRFDGDTEKAKIYEDFLPLTSHDVAEAIYFIANQPKHVNIQDVLMMGTQQASSLFVNRSGRDAL